MKYAAILACAVSLAACGGHAPRSADAVARAWSAALDKSDDTAAASLFAPSAIVVQDGELVLRTRAEAVTWNAALPCGGRITRIVHERSDQVLVVFRLTERPGHTCDAPGSDAAAVFRVEHGKIVLWHQTGVPVPAGAAPV
jgi:limonene-1,2-epoxide hydrolase